MKTKEEIVNGVIARFSNELGNIYEAGRAFERTNPWVVYKEELDEEKKVSYDEGYREGWKACENLFPEYYQNGLHDAWNVVNRIENSDDFTICELEDMLHVANVSDIYRDYTAAEVIEKFNEYDVQKNYQEFHVGDEVTDGSVIGVVTYVGYRGHIDVMISDGSIGRWDGKGDGWKKTGKTIPHLQATLNMIGAGL